MITIQYSELWNFSDFYAARCGNNIGVVGRRSQDLVHQILGKVPKTPTREWRKLNESKKEMSETFKETPSQGTE